MAIIAIASFVAIAVIAFVLSVGPRSIPEPEPVSPFAHLDERKAATYENLRDLQKGLAAVLAEVDRIKSGLPAAVAAPKDAVAAPKAVPRKPSGFVCDSCGASFQTALKFCGECGKPMKVGTA